VNDAPVANDDSESTAGGLSVVIDVIANDSAGPADEDQGLTIMEFSGPANGQVTGPDGSGNLTYTPDVGFLGSDTFTYTVCDSGGLCGGATVTLEVA
jgi:hypothetical protein